MTSFLTSETSLAKPRILYTVCPHGFTPIARSDKGARKGELMLDGTGCDGKGISTFCCPNDRGLPVCGW
jgi:chitinase